MKTIQGEVCEFTIDDGGVGTKTPIILVHSLGGNMTHWDEFVRRLRVERRVVRYDIRSHGKSGMPSDGQFSIEAYAQDIGTVADALGIERFILIGHSISGAAVYVYAAEHPDRVAAYIALDPIVHRDAHPPEIREFAQSLSSDRYPELLPPVWEQLTGPNPEVKARLLADVEAVPQEAIARSFQAFLEFDALSYAGKYQGPSLSIVTSSNDTPYSLHNLPPGFPHTVVHDTGHWVQLEKPEEIGSIFHEFLKHAGA